MLGRSVQLPLYSFFILWIKIILVLGGKYDMASELLRKVLQQNKSCTKEWLKKYIFLQIFLEKYN